MLEKFRVLLKNIGETIGLVQFYNFEKDDHEIHIQVTPTTCSYIEILRTPETKRVLQMNYSISENIEQVNAFKSFRLNNKPGNHKKEIPVSPEKFFNILFKKISVIN